MKQTSLLLCSFSILLAAYAEPPSHHGGSDPLPATLRSGVLSLAEVTRAALVHNPSIKARRARWEMMKARIPQVAAWEDLQVGVDFERSDTTRLNTYSDAEWMVMQKIPIAGKNRSLACAVCAEALGAIEKMRRQELEVVSKTRAAYFRLVNACAQLDVNLRNATLLGQFLDISRAKFEVGTQPQANVLVAENDVMRLGEDREDLERELSDAQS